MKQIEFSHIDGREYLNDIIIPCNKTEPLIDETGKYIKDKFYPAYLENHARIQRDKCVEIHTLFENIKYNDENSLKGFALRECTDMLTEAINIFVEICDEIKKIPKSNKLTMIKIKKNIIKSVNKYNEICTNIKNYSLEDNLYEKLVKRYQKIDPIKFAPGTFMRLYAIDKHTIIELGYYKEYSKYEKEIIELIKTKEIECDNYWQKKYQDKLNFTTNVLNNIKK